MTIRVLIIAQQRLIRQSFSLMLQNVQNIQVVGEAADGHEAFTLALDKKPHFVLMEDDLPKLSAVNTTRMILGCNPETRILILSSDETGAQANLALEAGAIGAVFMDADHQELIRIIRHYARTNEPLASPYLTTGRAHKPEVSPVPASLPALTRREKEIVDLLALGLRSQEIATTLHISVETVKVHIQHIYRKLGVKNRVGMLLFLQSTVLS